MQFHYERLLASYAQFDEGGSFEVENSFYFCFFRFKIDVFPLYTPL